ncbi:MAG: hypothetical protein Kow00108_13830 [Calditrichia bacterium]
MMVDVIKKILSYSLGEEVDVLINSENNGSDIHYKEKGYLFKLLKFNVAEESLNKVSTIKRVGNGVAFRVNPSYTYEYSGIIYPYPGNESVILDKLVVIFHKIKHQKSFLKVTAEHPYLDIEGALIEYSGKKVAENLHNTSFDMLSFSIPVTIKMKIKVKEDNPEKISTVEERNFRFTKQV